MRVYTPVVTTRNDLTGMTFGRLTPVRLLGSYDNQHWWLCSCECGGSVEAPTGRLNSGNTKSCGCVAIEKTRARSTTHGLRGHPLYGVWRRMIQRCEDENCTDYKYYGGRGITVSEEWHDFPTFLRDVGERPEGMTLERVENDQGYGAHNFVWATRMEQMQNTRGTELITYGGETRSISEWARRHGIDPRTFHARLKRLGYSFEDAISKEVKCGAMLNGKTWVENKKC